MQGQTIQPSDSFHFHHCNGLLSLHWLGLFWKLLVFRCCPRPYAENSQKFGGIQLCGSDEGWRRSDSWWQTDHQLLGFGDASNAGQSYRFFNRPKTLVSLLAHVIPTPPRMVAMLSEGHP